MLAILIQQSPKFFCRSMESWDSGLTFIKEVAIQNKLYDDTVTELLDQQVPTMCVSCRRRLSNMWYDDDCRSAKRSLRSLKRAARRVGPLSDTTLLAVIAWRTERRRYFDLTHQKRSEYWTTRIDSERLQPRRRLWQSFDQLLGCCQADIDTSQLYRFFDDKVAGFRDATAGAPAPQFTAVPIGCELRFFQPVTQTEVIKLVQALLDKQCSSDPLLMWLLKANVSVLAPFLYRLLCRSLQHRVVLSRMKLAYVMPI